MKKLFLIMSLGFIISSCDTISDCSDWDGELNGTNLGVCRVTD